MGSFRNEPAQNAGFWAILDLVVETLCVKGNGNAKKFYTFIEWITDSGDHNITLVSDQGFTTLAEATKYAKEVVKNGFVNAVEAADYDPDSGVEQWTKYHALPHEKALPSVFPWGSPMRFKPQAANAS